MLTCPFCGESNPPMSRRCSDCGASLENDLPNSYASEPDDRLEAGPESDDVSDDSELVELLRAGKKIPAIKLHRERTGVGLKESKEFVESLARRHGIEASGGGCAGALLLVSCACAIAVIVALRMG